MTPASQHKIRPFNGEDMDAILEIESDAFPKTPYSRRVFQHYRRILPDGFIVLEAGEDIAGYMLFDRSGHILSTAVRPEYRRRGYGCRMMMYAQEMADGPLWLEVRSHNRSAMAFYRQLGMRVIGRVPNYYGNDDAVMMVMEGKDKPPSQAP